jgi:hypothetical protein
MPVIPLLEGKVSEVYIATWGSVPRGKFFYRVLTPMYRKSKTLHTKFLPRPPLKTAFRGLGYPVTARMVPSPWYRGRYYDHNFLRFFQILCKQIGVFLKNQCYDQTFAKTKSSLSKERPFLLTFCKIFKS